MYSATLIGPFASMSRRSFCASGVSLTPAAAVQRHDDRRDADSTIGSDRSMPMVSGAGEEAELRVRLAHELDQRCAQGRSRR